MQLLHNSRYEKNVFLIISLGEGSQTHERDGKGIAGCKITPWKYRRDLFASRWNFFFLKQSFFFSLDFFRTQFSLDLAFNMAQSGPGISSISTYTIGSPNLHRRNGQN